jgi:SAM-dependent methyltransferase
MASGKGASRDVTHALEEVRSLYAGSLARYGIDSRSVGWRDTESQALRFEKLAYLLDADRTDGSFSINDWGCGYGEFFRYIDARYGDRLDRYHGYDISSQMLEAAREHIRDTRAELIESSDVTRTADYSFVSGTFHVRRSAAEEVWDGYVKQMIHRLAERSARGFAFNLFTTYVDFRQDDLFYADPAEYLTFCRSEISRYVALLHDYPLFEWTMIVLKEDRGARDLPH